MTDHALQEHEDLRREKAMCYINSPNYYQVCDACFSITASSVGICPYCGGYRWDRSPARVVAVARLIGGNPFPLGAGTVPRLQSV